MVYVQKALLFMILFRIISGTIEISAALLMYKFNDLHKALQINSMLALVGPTVLLLTTAIGLAGLSGKISLEKALCLMGGIVLILISLRLK